MLDELLKGVIHDVPWYMLFADDMVLIAESEQEVERMLEEVSMALKSKGLRIKRKDRAYGEQMER